MSHRNSIAWSCCALCIAAGPVLAQDVPGTIVSIEGELHDGWSITEQSFIPASQGGHFGLDTLSISEVAPQYFPDPTARGLEPLPVPRWADLWVTVIREPSDEPAMIAIDKSVLNATSTHWTDFHMEVGVLTFANEADPFPIAGFDGLDFKRDPAPIEENDRFGPAMFGSNAAGAPSLWWFAAGNGGLDRVVEYPGVQPGESGDFWLGLTVPDELFFSNFPETTIDHEIAIFVLRQHWSPSPGAAGTLALAALVAARRRRH